MRRILTAVLLIPLIVALFLFASPYWRVAVQLLFTLAGLWEFFRLAEAATGIRVFRLTGYAFGLAVGLLSLSDSMAVGILASVTLCAVALMTLALRPARELAAYLQSVCATLFGVIYVAVPLSLLVWISRQYDGRYWTLFVLAVIWVGDSAGFLIGKTLGRHQSSPRISPNKTWEGTIGSFAAALLVGVIWAQFFWHWETVLLAGLLNVAGQVGDLAESALKRGAGVKDSSELIPGHGGVLDRIDALLFAAPVLWYYWLWRAS